jgi:hypothetical protein
MAAILITIGLLVVLAIVCTFVYTVISAVLRDRKAAAKKTRDEELARMYRMREKEKQAKAIQAIYGSSYGRKEIYG